MVLQIIKTYWHKLFSKLFKRESIDSVKKITGNLDIDLLKNARNMMNGMDLCVYDETIAAANDSESHGNGEITEKSQLNLVGAKKFIRGRKDGLNKIRTDLQNRGLKVVCDEGEMPES